MAACSAAFFVWAYWPKKLQKLQNIICDDEVISVPLAWNLLSYTPDLNVQCELLEDDTILVSYVDSFADDEKKVLFYATYDPQCYIANSFSKKSAFLIKKPSTPRVSDIYRQANEREQNKLFNLLFQQLPEQQSSFACSSS